MKIMSQLKMAAVGALFSLSLKAAAFSYTNVDLVVGFRAVLSDLVVDIGPAANYEGLPAGTVVPIGNIQASQLNAAFASLNNVTWSVSAAMRGNTNYGYPLQTIFVTSPRPSTTLSGSIWKRQSQFAQGGVASVIDAIGNGAVTYGNSQPAGTNNTATGIVIPSDDPNSYTTLITSDGDYSGTFQGSVENTTPSNFANGGQISRSVLFKLLPGSNSGTVLGYFDFKSDGTLTFTAGAPLVRPTITRTVQQNGIATVSFVSEYPLNYRLRSSGSLTAPVSGWSIGSTGIGTGATISLQNTNAAGIQFYSIEATY